jgi:hypothetical protein
VQKLTANFVLESSVTAGVGNVTLVAVVGWMRHSDRWAVLVPFYYSIRDGNNWELGKSTLAAAPANTLVRPAAVLETLVGGVVTLNGAPMALSGAGALVRVVAPEEFISTLSKVENVLAAVNFAAVDGFSYGITAINLTATLAAVPVVGDRVEFYAAGAATTGFSVDPNGGKINGVAGVMTVDVPDYAFSMVYVSAGYGWKVKA